MNRYDDVGPLEQLENQKGLVRRLEAEVERLRVDLREACKVRDAEMRLRAEVEAEVERLRADNATMFKSLDDQTTNALQATSKWQQAEALLAEEHKLRLAQEFVSMGLTDRLHQAETRLAKVTAKLEEKLAILARGFCSPTFDREDVAVMLRDALAAAQEEKHG